MSFIDLKENILLVPLQFYAKVCFMILTEKLKGWVHYSYLRQGGDIFARV